MLRTSRHVDADAERVWTLLVDTAWWPRWGPTVAGGEVDGHPDGLVRAGSRGRVRTAAGFWLPFEVTSFEPGRRWSWDVAGIAATTHEVRPSADGRGCDVTFGVPLWAPAYLAVCALALRRIDRLAREG